MRALSLGLAVLGAGCVDDGGDGGPIITQGGPPSPSTPAPVSTVSGRVCVIEDLQDVETCSTTAGRGLTVTLGSSVTTTQVDGSFTVTVPPGLTNASHPTFTVTGPGVVPTLFPFTLPFIGTGSVPVLDEDQFARALATNGVPLDDETGTILATVRDDNGPASGGTARTTPDSAFGPFYDAATPTTWGIFATGERGVVLIPGLTARTVDLGFRQTVSELETRVADVPVRAGGVTIIDSELTGAPTP